MAGTLEESLRLDLRCGAAEAAKIGSLARDRMRRIAGVAEDSEEDLVVRLRDPRMFGEFAIPLLEDASLSLDLRATLAEHVFDLLPLPRGAGDVIVVESRAPRGLLSVAAFLDRTDRFSVLHGLHLVYALFLDRDLPLRVDRPVRSSVLRRVLANGELSEGLRVFYGALHLASVPETEARVEFRRLLKDADVSPSVRSSMARLVEAPDVGRRTLASIAREEGILSVDPLQPDDPQAVANIPRLPEALGAVARTWRRRT